MPSFLQARSMAFGASKPTVLAVKDEFFSVESKMLAESSASQQQVSYVLLTNNEEINVLLPLCNSPLWGGTTTILIFGPCQIFCLLYWLLLGCIKPLLYHIRSLPDNL